MRQPRLAAVLALLLLPSCNLGNESLVEKLYENYDFKQQIWTKVDVGAIEDLTTITMVDANSGYAGGKKGTMFTTKDGGATWTGLYPAVMTGQDLVALSFVSPVQGFAASTSKIFSTQDGGNTWAIAGKPALGPREELRRLRFVTAGVGYASSDKAGYQTLDGGKTWDLLQGGVGANGEFTVTEDTVFEAGGSNLYRGQAGGGWTGLLDTSPQCAGCQGLASFPTAKLGFVVAGAGNHGNGSPVPIKVFRTKDGGTTWEAISPLDYQGKPLGTYLQEPGNGNVNQLQFTDALNGWLLWGTGLLATYDGGNTWIAQNQAFAERGFNHYAMEGLKSVGFTSIQVQDAKHAWGVANKYIWRYDGAIFPVYHEGRK